jgi:hypothetical protein
LPNHEASTLKEYRKILTKNYDPIIGGAVSARNKNGKF